MSIRSVIIGFLGAAVICGFTYFNDFVLHQTFLVGNHFPLVVYGPLLLFLLFNAGLFAIKENFAFTGKELAIIVGMTLVSCTIPSSGLMRVFPTVLAMPHHHEKTKSSWGSSRVVKELPHSNMLLNVDREVASGTVTSSGDREVTLSPNDEANARDYQGRLICVTTTDGKRQVRRITDYDPETSVAKVDASWDLQLETGNRYVITESNESEVLTPYLEGQQTSSEDEGGIFINSIIPWHAWKKPLMFWVPLILVVWMAIMGLSLVVHKQWSEHEHLPYPISTVVSSLFPSEGEGLSAIIKDRKFLIGFGIVFLIYMMNYLQAWFPEYLPRLPLQFNFSPIIWKMKLKGAWFLGRPSIYFTVVAIAFFLASDVSFSLGMAAVIPTILFGTVLMNYGINWNEGPSGIVRNKYFLVFGAYMAVACSIFYTGRYYYYNVAKRAMGLKSVDEIDPVVIWGGRLFLVTSITFVIMLLMIGVPLPFAGLYVFLFLTFFVVMGRIMAETGLFFIQAGRLLPAAIMLGLLGARSMGPEILVMLMLVGMLFHIDPRECLMPFVMNSLKLFDLQKVKISKGSTTLVASLLLGLAVAIPATLYFQYSHGVSGMNWWATNSVPTFPFNNALTVRNNLKARDSYAESVQASTIKRLGSIKPMQWSFLWWTIAGFGLALALSICRIKFPKWPLHPVMFLVMLGYSIRCFWFSFLLGWLLKAAITRFGGAKFYRDLKPLFIGALAGELMGALVPVVYGLIYFAITKESPPPFTVFPT